jgi:uncharacterized HhH-GPD family protein
VIGDPIDSPGTEAVVGLVLTQNPEADALLDREPLALLIGMILDQQVPLEWAFTGPYELTQRLGGDLDARELADYDTSALVEVFARRPALHRYPKSMAARVQQACRVIADRYDGDVTGLWRDIPDGHELLKRVAALPGFGRQKAQIFVALLGKQYGVTPPGWREAAGAYGAKGARLSAADIIDDESRAAVRAYKQQLKAQAKADSARAGESGEATGGTRGKARASGASGTSGAPTAERLPRGRTVGRT